MITFEDIPNSMMSKVTVDIDAKTKEEYYIPKQLADLITNLNSLGILARNVQRSVAT